MEKNLSQLGTPGIRTWILPVCLFLLASCGDIKQEQAFSAPLKQFEEELEYSKFLDPPAVYRSFPFYSLNDRLSQDEIAEQVRGFKEAGFGGFYLHGRTGLLTGYFSDEWWKVIDAAVNEATESGLHAWFYDEYNWPSGYAGGIIPRMGPAFRAKCLARLKMDTPMPEGAVVLAEDQNYRYVEYTSPLGNSGFYGTSYVDLLNPEVVREFIKTSYLPYSRRYGASSAQFPPGIFTDEPHIHARYFNRATPHAGVLTWSPVLAGRFQELCGKDLYSYLPLLFTERDNWREIRLNYYRAVALQFEENFSAQISSFCKNNEMVFTGHYLGEDVLEKVRDRIGNAMLHYRNMQQPGMDHLGLTIRNRLITARSLSSAANQYDIPRRLSEIFGISGQNMNFEDRKWLGGWHAVLGVNHYCPHLTLYSMAGLRKRDYPPTFSYHQPYWPYNKHMEDYLGRISYAATVGRYDPQFLVVHPLESEYIKGRDDGEFTSGLLQLMESMQEAHYDYDLGDEQILADTALVENGKLVVGAMAYPNVILPDMISICETTLELLTALAGEGGKLFNAGRFPQFIDGKADSLKLREFRDRVTELPAGSPAAELPGYVSPQITLEGKGSEKIWTHIRRTGQGAIILLYNSSHTEPVRFRVHSELLKDRVLLWDPSGGICYRMAEKDPGGYEVEIPSSSLIWLSAGILDESGIPVLEYSLPGERRTLVSLKGKWQGKRLQPNAITLDFAKYSVDGEDGFSSPEPVIGIMSRLSDKMYSGPMLLRYPVHVTDIPANCSLVVEDPEICESIRVNGGDIAFDYDQFYLDHHFPVSDITGLLMPGFNVIELSLNFVPPVPGSQREEERYGTELESIYLIGDFAVEGYEGELTVESQRNETGDFIPRPVHGFKAFSLISERDMFAGDLTVEGYPFYAGEFELESQFTLDSIGQGKQYFVEFPNTEAIVSRIELNGDPAGTLYWSPFTLDITHALHPGENTLKITLVSSLRNLLGPHHHPKAELTRVGPNSFTGSGGFPDPGGDRNWYDLRLEGGDLKLWTDTYYHIPFGFLEPVEITVSGIH